MRLLDVKGVSAILAGNKLARDPFWRREVEEITEEAITLFYARASIKGLKREAIEAIERAQSAVIVAAFHEQIGPSPLITHSPPPDPFLVDELVTGLAKLSQPRCRACVFALEMKLDPSKVTSIQWKDIPPASQQQAFTPLAREVLVACDKTRHIRLPYVFWEWATPRIAAPLMELQNTIELAFSCPWPALVEKHSRMIKLDRGADCASFLQLADEIRTGRL